jgi:hypothetical protein
MAVASQVLPKERSRVKDVISTFYARKKTGEERRRRRKEDIGEVGKHPGREVHGLFLRERK